ncbi:MAG: hypothetical protein P4M14_03520 [Gammaproteobacteria bacterium]|nr:hypothetical protein [Gammaproteobacteria bacterium]
MNTREEKFSPPKLTNIPFGSTSMVLSSIWDDVEGEQKQVTLSAASSSSTGTSSLTSSAMEYAFYEDFDELMVLDTWSKWENKTPERVLAFDIDDTLIDYKKSVEQDKIVFIDEQRLVRLLLSLKESVMVVIVTKRSSDPDNEYTGFLSVKNIIDILAKLCGKNVFSSIFFTAGGSKTPVLDEIYARYLTDHPASSRELLAIIDDLVLNISECDRGRYKTILAKPDGSHWDDVQQDFLAKEVLREANFNNITEDDLCDDDEDYYASFRP